MVKIKIFDAAYTQHLENQVNDWLADNRTSDIMNIQYQVNNDAFHAYTDCITYSDGN